GDVYKRQLFGSFQAFGAALRRRDRFSDAGLVTGMLGLALLVDGIATRPEAILALAPALAAALLGLFGHRGRLARQSELEILGIVATSVQGGAGLYVGGGRTVDAALLALCSASYFLLSLIWVRVRLSREVPGRRPLFDRRANHPVSLGLLFVSLVAGVLAHRPVAGLLPGLYLVRSVLPVPRRKDGKLHIPKLGIQESIVAAAFAIGLGLFLGP
ncbi:MAG: hypothetical protein QUU85_05390, partial [Candidatus Eisenbacteria bacterium]|nr:hypothetical protein [Candidatus Eisenbacteria bacterium]